MKHGMLQTMFLLLCCICLMSSAALAGASGQTADDFVVSHGDRETKRVAITMDDCYRISNVKRTLAICEKYGVPVTFFIVGGAVKPEHQPVWHHALSLGCEIGNHTYSHISVAKASPDMIRTQLRETQAVLDEVLGFHYPMRYFRPPYGKIKRASGETILPLLQAEGFEKVVLWDVSNIHFREAYVRVRNGSILLFHANIMDVKCIEQLVPKLLEDGYEIVTLSELFGRPPIIDPAMLPATATNLPELIELDDETLPSDPPTEGMAEEATPQATPGK